MQKTVLLKIVALALALALPLAGECRNACWVGGTSHSLGTGANWADEYGNAFGGAPESGDTIVFDESLTQDFKPACDSNMSVAGVVFQSGEFEIGGSAKLSVTGAITNNSEATQIFGCTVDFGEGDIDVKTGAALGGSVFSGPFVEFRGGVRGVSIANHNVLSGGYTLTKDGNFKAATGGDGRLALKGGATLNVKVADDMHELYVARGATFHAEKSAALGFNGGSTARLCCWNLGEIVYGLIKHNGKGAMWFGGYGARGNDALNTGVIRIGGAMQTRSGENSAVWLHAHGGNTADTIFVGAGGLGFGAGNKGYYGVENSSHAVTLRPWRADYRIGGGSGDFDFRLGNGGNAGGVQLVIDTSDEDGLPRTVTLAGRVKTEAATSMIKVIGCGTNIVASASPLFTGTNVVSNGATVGICGGCGFENGCVKVEDGGTLLVRDSAAQARAGSVIVADGGILEFRFESRNSVPALAGAVSADGALHVKVTAEDGIRPPSGVRLALTSGAGLSDGAAVELAAGSADWACICASGGEICLEAKSDPFRVILK